MSAFQKAVKKQAKLRLALEGPAGYGKTMTALLIASELSDKIAYVDTEAGSASKYADRFNFDVMEVHPPFHPDRASQAISDAADNGYGVVVLDSLSHFWTGEGGLLEIVDQVARAKYRGDSHRAWKDAGEIQQRLVDSILRSPIHVLAAMRTKKDYVREEVEDGGRTKTRIRAAGTKVVQRDDLDFEFDIVGRFETPTILTILKSRCAELPPDTFIDKPGAELAEALKRWLDAGEPLADAASHARLTEIVLELMSADSSKRWENVVERYAEREFRHGVDMLSVSEMQRTIAQFEEHLETLKPSEAFPPPTGEAAAVAVAEGEAA